MISKVIQIACILFICSLLRANVSSIENNFTYYLFALNQDTTLEANQDTTFEDSISIVSTLGTPEYKYKSTPKAMLMSGLLPGMGQVYLGKWKRAIIYGVIEAVALGTWYRYNNEFDNKKRKYQDYANNNWSFSLWLKDYYQWNDTGNPYQEIFINFSDGSYPEIWDGSHFVSFTWAHQSYNVANGTHHPRFIRTSGSDFYDIYQELCGELDPCTAGLIESYIKDFNVEIIRDHTFYENIGKYDNFFAGWLDNDEIYLYEKVSTGEKLAMSPKKRFYRNDYDKAEEYYDIAGYALSVILTNHVASIVDALLTSKFNNAKKKIILSMRPYYDYRNKWGVGGVKINFKL